jgi:hypothetical protein
MKSKTLSSTCTNDIKPSRTFHEFPQILNSTSLSSIPTFPSKLTFPLTFFPSIFFDVMEILSSIVAHSMNFSLILHNYSSLRATFIYTFVNDLSSKTQVKQSFQSFSLELEVFQIKNTLRVRGQSNSKLLTCFQLFNFADNAPKTSSPKLTFVFSLTGHANVSNNKPRVRIRVQLMNFGCVKSKQKFSFFRLPN